jgi:hypothetical protein
MYTLAGVQAGRSQRIKKQTVHRTYTAIKIKKIKK